MMFQFTNISRAASGRKGIIVWQINRINCPIFDEWLSGVDEWRGLGGERVWGWVRHAWRR